MSLPTVTYYLFIFAVLFAMELAYFRIAGRLNIIDKPNQRSSHTQVTLRGGGIIFPISVFLFFLLNQFPYPWFVLGLASIAAVSFADDVREQSRRLRFIIHIVAVGLLLYQAGVFQLPYYWIVLAFALVITAMNACNFMDGINGITTAYAFTVLATLFILNRQVQAFDENLIIFLALGNGVFAFFNFREKARCFAGDVGSISMAFCLLFLTVFIMVKTGSFLFVLLFAVYGVDSGITILDRLKKGENIFQPHRQHLYQYLANEKGWPHLAVSVLYMLVQAIVSVGVVLLWRKELAVQAAYIAIVLAVLSVIYVLAKRNIVIGLQKNNNPSIRKL